MAGLLLRSFLPVPPRVALAFLLFLAEGLAFYLTMALLAMVA
jgi:hypothetical protein